LHVIPQLTANRRIGSGGDGTALAIALAFRRLCYDSAGGKMPRQNTGKRAAARGRLRSMRVSESFRDFVLDQLAGFPGLRPQAMFGGIGLYAGEHFFGIIAADVLYFKVDDTNRPEYEARGSRPFQPYDDKPMTMPYFFVPPDVLEDAEMLRRWADRSVGVARSAAKVRTGRRKAKKR
jgi:DNA transformation protein